MTEMDKYKRKALKEVSELKHFKGIIEGLSMYLQHYFPSAELKDLKEAVRWAAEYIKKEGGI